MMTFKEKCLREIQQSGARLTSARISVVDCIEASKRALTAREIFERTRKTRSGRCLDQVTVYRVLEFLHSLKLIHRIGADGGYRPCTHHGCGPKLHLLASCTGCGSAQEEHVPLSALKQLEDLLKEKLRFTPTDHCVQVSGICADCAA